DITGASVPTDPTMPFDPPTTNATNPPLNGSKAAGQMLAIIAGAIDRVSSTRAELGAIQNRFEANIANLSNVVENVSAARSRILDADIAAETANLTQLSIMQQAATAILAQANQQPQLALQLLK
ncbi:MAG: flagellin FliC, partial [Magnetococcales bacterium]|nr:flagellin FliC [Magnetococcales bacterium]